jgi:anaphase-promoting complex subunit 11
MTFEVRIKSWHAVASWTWNAGAAPSLSLRCGRTPPDVRSPASYPYVLRPTDPILACGPGDDVCGICRMPFDGCPPDGKYPGDDSPVVWGICTHAFHLQCINRWLQSQTEQKCPFCRRQWEFKQAAIGGEESDS